MQSGYVQIGDFQIDITENSKQKRKFFFICIKLFFMNKI